MKLDQAQTTWPGSVPFQFRSPRPISRAFDYLNELAQKVSAVPEVETESLNKTQIQIQNLNLWFGSKQVLKSISGDMRRDKLTALIGPSGCGKTSLLRSLNRMHDLDKSARWEGTAILSGEQNILSLDADPMWVRMRVGMVFQKPNPFPKSIFENVIYGLRVRGEKNRKVLAERCEQALTQASLWSEVKDRLHVGAASLSGGQQQRLCLARSLAVRPEVLLLDEPTSALDPRSTEKIEELLLELKKSTTLVMVTHNLQQAKRIADDVGMMWLGELVEFRAAKDLFAHPQNEKTAAYVSGRVS